MSQIDVYKDNGDANNLNGLGRMGMTKYSTWRQTEDIMTDCKFALR
jgi:hypothetical protein